MTSANFAVELVGQIRSANELALKWRNESVAKRTEKIENFWSKVEPELPHLFELEADETGISKLLLEEQSGSRLRRCHDIQISSPASGYPIGLCGVFLPRVKVVESFVESALQALAAGSPMLSKFSSSTPKLFEKFQQIVDDPGLPMVMAARDQAGLIAQHPGVRAIKFYGQRESFDSILKKVDARKKISALCSMQNTSIVLADADLEDAADQLARAIWLGRGVLPESVSRIFVVNKVYEDFQSLLQSQIEKVSREHSNVPKSLSPKAMELVNKDPHKKLWSHEESETYLIGDLTYCSEFHQQDQLSAVSFLGDVKYPHEAITWTNTSPFRRVTSVFGADRERCEKLAGKLDVSIVRWNQHWGNEPEYYEGSDLSSVGPQGVTGGRQIFMATSSFVSEV